MWEMPRVSDEHLAARREQILDAARRCFLRNGFHVTSMQDVIAEAGLSVGAVYRYFKSKNEIVTAIASQTVATIHQEFATIVAHRPAYPLVEAMDRALTIAHAQTGPDGMFRLALQVWAEAVRDPELAATISDWYDQARDTFTDLARQARDRGELPADADLTGTGTVLFGMLPGYAVQRLLTGQPDRDAYLAGVRALLAAPGPPAG